MGCAHRLDPEEIRMVSLETTIPPQAVVVIATTQASRDQVLFLIFDCDSEGIAKFAFEYSRGIALDDWPKKIDMSVVTDPGLRLSRDHSDCCPGFDLTKITNGFFFQRPNCPSGAFCWIDMDKNRVYLMGTPFNLNRLSE